MQQAGAPLLIIGKGGGERFLQHLREGAEATGGLDFEVRGSSLQSSTSSSGLSRYCWRPVGSRSRPIACHQAVPRRGRSSPTSAYSARGERAAASAPGAVVRCVTSCEAFREATSPLGSDQIRVGVSPSATHGEVISTCEFTTAQRSRSMTLALCCPSAAARTWRWSRRRNSVSAPSRPWPTP